MALAVVGAPGVDTCVLAAPVMDLALVDILTCFSVFIQLQSRRTAAVEASDGVAAESLAASVGLLALVHIVLAAGAVEACGTVTELGGSLTTLAAVEANPVAAHGIQTTGLPVELRPSMAALVHGLIILPVDLSVSCVVRRPSLVSHAPRLSHAALLPHFDHACEGLHARLPLGDQRDLPLHTHVGHVGLEIAGDPITQRMSDVNTY